MLPCARLQNKAETTKTAVADNALTKEAGQSASAGYHKSKRAGAEDWTAVHAIAQEYAKEIANTVALREKLKTSEYYLPNGGDIRNPERSTKILASNRAAFQEARKVRDLEREQWTKMAEYLSPYELRKYKLEHSQFAHDLWRGTEWFQPNKGEFSALFTYNERRHYDKVSDSGKNMNELSYSARKKIDAVREKMWHSVPKIFRNGEAVEISIDALEGKDMEFYREWRGLKSGIDSMSRDRWLEYSDRNFFPPESRRYITKNWKM